MFWAFFHNPLVNVGTLDSGIWLTFSFLYESKHQRGTFQVLTLGRLSPLKHFLIFQHSYKLIIIKFMLPVNEDCASTSNCLSNKINSTRKESHYVFERHIQDIYDFVTKFLLNYHYFLYLHPERKVKTLLQLIAHE